MHFHKLLLSIQYNSTFNSLDSENYYENLYMEIFHRQKNQITHSLGCIIWELKGKMNVVLKYVVPYYAHRYCISRIVNVKWNEKKKLIKKEFPLAVFITFSIRMRYCNRFCTFVIQMYAYILQDDSCSSYWFKIFLTNWRNGWLRRQIDGLKSSKILLFFINV